MIPEDPIGIIELGNVNLKCLILKIDKSNNSEILSTSITPSDGISNDVVVNLAKAVSSVRLAISTAEKKAKTSLKKINVVLEQPDFLCTKFSKQKKINGSKINRHDIEFLLNEAKKQLIHNDKNQSIIHIFNYNYIVDGKVFLEEPINVFADSFSHEITFITAPKNNLKNINQVFIECDIEIEKIISRTFALGAQLLNSKELELGSAIINLGSKKVSLGLFKNFALVHSVTIPIGNEYITKDISKVCSLSFEESEIIRNNIDFSFENNDKMFDKNNYLRENYFINSNFRKISKDLILKVTKARIDEIFEILKKQLVVPELKLNPVMNFLLISDGFALHNLEKYFSSFFTSENNEKNENTISSKKDKDLDKNFAPTLGALKIIKDGWETEAIPDVRGKNIEKIGLFAKIFKYF